MLWYSNRSTHLLHEERTAKPLMNPTSQWQMASLLWLVKYWGSPSCDKKLQISLPCTCHLTAKKWGFIYLWNCALACIEDWFPLKAHARSVNQRLLWTSSQRDTSNDLIHPCITQIFQSVPACASLCLVKKLHLAELSVQLFRELLIPPGKLGGPLWNTNPIAISRGVFLHFSAWFLVTKAFHSQFLPHEVPDPLWKWWHNGLSYFVN